MIEVPDINFPARFPAELPDADTLTSDAEAFGKHATTITTTYNDTSGKWNPLSNHMSFPESEMVFGGLENNVAPYADYLNTGITDMSSALTTFASDVRGFKPTWTNLREEVAAFNRLPQEPSEPDDVDESTTYRNTDARTALVIRLYDATSDYRGYVRTCVASINDANPAKNPSWEGSTHQAFLAQTKKTWTNTRSHLDRAGRLSKRGGRWTFKITIKGAKPATPANFLRDRIPKGVADKALGKAPKGKFTNVSKPFTKNPVLGKYFDKVFDNTNPKKFSLIGGVDNVGGRASFLIGLPKLEMPKWATRGKPGAVVKSLSKAGNTALKGVQKADGFISRAEKSKVMKFGGPALGVLDAGMTYKDEYSKGYNESLREHPERTPTQHMAEATTDAAIVGTSTTAGKVIGGVVGRSAGAAIGQAIIPIPGVGAAIGGFAGGIAGDWIGGKVGGAVGGFINDWREGGATGALGAAADSVSDAVDGAKQKVGDAVDAVKHAVDDPVDAAKKVGKKVFDKLTPW